ncbi:MAG: hypothetical protein CME06_03090 [Gemmatimonadetes bacterium]|nr:hypothetical protein [Gemmatimonadota bacterium]
MSFFPRVAPVLLGLSILALPPLAQAGGQSVSLTILHTNDWHGYAFEQEYKGRLSGGVAACAAEVARVRKERPGQVLVLDAGDLLSGHSAARFEAEGVRGLPFVKLWDRIGYDAWAIGNHDLDHGRANLVAMLEKIESPALCANWLSLTPHGGPPHPARDPAPVACRPFMVFERAGLKIGVVGLVTHDLRDLVSAKTLAGSFVASPTEALEQLWPVLDEQSDIQIALTHNGLDADRELAKALPGLEAIVGGHSHRFLREPVVEGEVVIVQAGCYGKVLGRLDLEISDGKVVKSEGRLLNLPRPADESIEPGLLAAEKALREKVRVLEAEVIGTVPADFGRSYYQPSPLGAEVAEAFRRAAKADIAFVNSGGLRTDLSAGPLTRAQLMELLPFDNELVSFRLTGAEVEQICRYNAVAAQTEAHGILQVAGLDYTYSPGASPDEVVLGKIAVGSKPLEAAKSYLCTGSDYITSTRAEKYFGRTIDERTNLGVSVREAFERAVRTGEEEASE